METCSLTLACALKPDAPRHLIDTLHGGSETRLAATCVRNVIVERRVPDDTLDEYLTLIEHVAPYSETAGYVGYVRFGWDVAPTLIYFRDGRAYFV